LRSEASFANILREHPSVSQVLVNIARQLAQRLRGTSRELQSLTN